MVAGVLTILAAMGAGFYSLILSQSRSALRYSDAVSAELAVNAAMADAVARVREDAFKHTEDPSAGWYTADYLHGAQKSISYPAKNPKPVSKADTFFPFTRALSNKVAPNSEQYSLSIVDAASKININSGDNLGPMLDNLCRAVGSPLVAADLDAIQPRCWKSYGAATGLFDTPKNRDDTGTKSSWDLYYVLDENHDGKDDISGKSMPLKNDNTALYGDGYAIAAYRSRHGRFNDIYEIKRALTSTPNPLHPELETLEVEVKFSAIKDYITTSSWVDTSTVCTGKFEWVDPAPQNVQAIDPDKPTGGPSSMSCQVLIDRDKSWIADDPKNDPKNRRGSLRGCYVSIVNGHGAGQLRRIATNGIDWIAIKTTQKMEVLPGPISSYMIVAKEDALTENVAAPTSPSYVATLPKMDASGALINDPDIDYSRYPLCIHRAPVNINTAPDKVLAALFMGLDIQHGHPVSVGTDADLKQTQIDWKYTDANGVPYDPHDQLAYVLKPRGVKRIPASAGKLILDRPKPWATADENSFGYLYNFGSLTAGFKPGKTGDLNEAQELAYRVIMARTRTKPVGTRDPDPTTADAGDGPAPYNGRYEGFERGPFKSWDDFYFRVVKPWDDIRSSYFIHGKKTIPNAGGSKEAATGRNKASVGRLIMAHFNPNTDILKFNPNIEWIDRWGRNFTDMEAVMSYTDDNPDKQPGDRWTNPQVTKKMSDSSRPIFATEDAHNAARGSVVLCPANVTSTSDANAGVYMIRSFRYRSDEMLDKTDLNRSTTEFAFDSKGIFEIQAIGRVVHSGEVRAERRSEALIKIYDVWRETTQSQFVRGTIAVGSAAPACKAGTTYAGQVARDSKNVSDLMPLTTLPEPLVPLKFQLKNSKGLTNKEVVDPDNLMRDAFGNPKSTPASPDVVVNRVLPANYDGQIVLSTNTLAFDPSDGGDKDTFLASFNGDLDSDTCKGNGREQAKMPHTPAGDGFKYRVVDTCGLLGVMNDTLVDIDTDLPEKPKGFSWTKSSPAWDGWSEPPTGPQPSVYRFNVLTHCLKALNVNNYWENVTLRQGDLRSDGVYLSGPGVSGNESTLKYCFGDGSTASQDTEKPGNAKLNFNPGSADGNLVTMWMKPVWHHNDRHTHPLFDATNPGYSEGGTACRALYLKKHGATVCTVEAPGGTSAAYVSGNHHRTDDLNFTLEGNDLEPPEPGKAIRIPEQTDQWRDLDMLSNLHGGVNWVPNRFIWHDPVLNPKVQLTDFAPKSGGHEEAPSYRVQPFRWSYVGVRWRFHGDPKKNGSGDGHWVSNDSSAPQTDGLINNMARPFISTQTTPEMPAGVDATKFRKQYWASLPNSHSGMHGFDAPCDIGDTGYVNSHGTFNKTGDSRQWLYPNGGAAPRYDPRRVKNKMYERESGFGVTGQPVKWKWADPAGIEDPLNKVFGVNNLNQDMCTWIYHHLPEDGTYAVIDELKISSKERVLQAGPDWKQDRGVREQTLSRYYLPPTPEYRDACPTFTSQTMLDSLKGAGAAAVPDDFITVARVTWSVFTPRFLHERIALKSTRSEYVTHDKANQQLEMNPFRGPFDYDKYNEVYSARETGDTFPFGVDRPTPKDYGPYQDQYTQPHFNRGVEVELLNNDQLISGSNETYPASGLYDNNIGTFSNPDVINRYVDKSGTPTAKARLLPAKLRYRVRFRYPVDQLVDKGAGKKDGDFFWVDAASQYLLDTPVFDDISVTYFITPQILSYKVSGE